MSHNKIDSIHFGLLFRNMAGASSNTSLDMVGASSNTVVVWVQGKTQSLFCLHVHFEKKFGISPLIRCKIDKCVKAKKDYLLIV